MLRSIVEKRKAAIAVVLLVMAAALLSVWPLRLYREDHVFQGHGNIQRISDPVDYDYDAGNYFRAQYAHLQTMSVWVDSVVQGDSFDLRLFRIENGTTVLIAEENVPFAGQNLPGYVEVPVDVDLNPGEEYVYLVRGHEDGSFRVGYESVELGEEDPSAPLYDLGFYHDTSVDGLAVATRLVYRMPLDKVHSAEAGAGILLCGILAAVLFHAYYRKKPQKNHLITVESVLQHVLTPVVCALGILFLAFIFLQKYDERWTDNIFYAVGIILTVLILLYALWYDRTGIPDMMNGRILSREWPHVIIVVCLALILASCTVYMNAVNDILHNDAEYRIVMLMCIMILAMGRREDILHPAVFLGGAAAAVCAALYYHGHRLAEGEKEYLENNAMLRGRVCTWVFLTIAVISVALMILHALRNRRTARLDAGYGKKPAGNGSTRIGLPLVSWLCIPTALFALCMLIFRNGRRWIVVMIVMYLLIYTRYAFWKDRRLWLRDLCYGILLHFVCAVIFSMLHRYYFAFIYSRFPMQFHTVTVTAYYLLIVEAAAVTLLLTKIRKIDDGRRHSLSWYAARLWKEFLLFAAASSYMLMSLSRAGIFELAFFMVLSCILVLHGKQQAGRRIGPGRALLAMILAVVVVFPAIFTDQRLVSTTVGDPVWYDEVEPYPDELIRHPRWNDKWFMSVEVFVRDFGDRVLGGNLGSDLYDSHNWGAHQKVDKADPRVVGRIEASPQQLLASLGGFSSVLHTSVAEPAAIRSGSVQVAYADTDGAVQTDGMRLVAAADAGSSAAVQTDSTESGIGLENGDYSNGRIELWKIYLRQITPTGHYNMGATLPTGEAAVHAHNILLQMAFDCGPAAGVLMAVFLIVILIAAVLYYNGSARMRSGRYALLLLLVVLGFEITGMVEWIFTFCNPFCIMFLLACAPLFFREPQSSRRGSGRTPR